MKLADIKEEFSKYFVIKDPYALEIIFATLVGNLLIDRDPLWTMIIGPSSGGKTTLIAPCATIPHIYFIDDLTEKTLLSGYKQKGKESSLLKQIGSGVMCFSDFTSILAKNPVSRGEILTQLKLVYDGKITKYTGTGGIPWEGKVGFLGAATPDVYTYLENSRSMGERFLYYCFEQPTNEEVMAKHAEMALSAKEITEIMQAFYSAYFEEISVWVKYHPLRLKMTEEQKKRVHAAAIFCVNGKATIHTNFKSGKPDSIPNISGVGRDSKIFDTLLHSLQVMHAFEIGILDRGVTDEMISIVEKCAYSSINRERRKILEILCESQETLTGSQIGAREGLGLEKESVELYLAPLHAVGMIRKKTGGGANRWYVEKPEVIDFVKRVSPMIPSNLYVQPIEPEPDDELNKEFFENDTLSTPAEVSE